LDNETYVKLMAEAVGLPIPPEYFAGTLANFNRAAAMAALVMQSPLPPDVEPAPVFSLADIPGARE
jgi:hypothetical protein